jgi:hypothetical protein
MNKEKKINQIIISLEVPICLSFSTDMSSTEYRNVAYVQYRDDAINRQQLYNDPHKLLLHEKK